MPHVFLRPSDSFSQQNEIRIKKRIENLVNILLTYKEQIISEKNKKLQNLSIEHTLYEIVLESRTNSPEVIEDESTRSKVEYIYIKTKISKLYKKELDHLNYDTFVSPLIEALFELIGRVISREELKTLLEKGTAGGKRSRRKRRKISKKKKTSRIKKKKTRKRVKTHKR